MPFVPFRAGLARLAFVLILLTGAAGDARAGAATIAVAANFTEAATAIAAAFETATGHRAEMSFGATGLLFAQIAQGAPFDAFLAADRARPARAEAEGLAVAGSRFTYATGRLVLFSADPQLVAGAATLRRGGFAKIAIANPATAPYGAAAVEAMTALGVLTPLRAKIVQGTNIAQTFQFVATGNAELGFVAASQVAGHAGGSRWLVPDDLHTPIAQDAVLLTHGGGNEAARAFLAFLRGPAARAIVEKYGYGPAE